MGSPHPRLRLALAALLAVGLAALAGLVSPSRAPLVSDPRPTVDLRAFASASHETHGSRSQQAAGHNETLLVHLRSGYRARGGDPVGTAPLLRAVTVPTNSAATTTRSISKLAGVVAVEPDTVMRWSDAAINGAPSDPLSASSWTLPAIGWPTAPRIDSTPLIAVLDSGLDTAHPEFAGEIRPGLPKVASTFNAVTGGSDVPDEFGHGTATSSVAAALTGNGLGVAGVAPASQIMMVKVGGLDGVRTSDAIKGIDYASEHGAKVINMSFSTPDRSLALRDAVYRAVARGVVVVAAVGNDGCAQTGGGNELQYPAGFAHVIGVAASTPARTIACFSNWGAEVDIAAPGTNVQLAVPDSESNGTLRQVGGYRQANGTSFAAPAVAGAAALLLGKHPEWKPDQVRQALLATAVDIGPRGIDPYAGHGLLQVPKALALSAIGPADRDEVDDDITQARKVRTVTGALTFNGVLDRADDPSDVRAVRVGRSGTVSAGVSKIGRGLRTEVIVWSAATATTASGSSSDKKNVRARGSRTATARKLEPGSTVYVQVVSRRGAASYRLKINAR